MITQVAPTGVRTPGSTGRQVGGPFGAIRDRLSTAVRSRKSNRTVPISLWRATAGHDLKQGEAQPLEANGRQYITRWARWVHGLDGRRRNSKAAKKFSLHFWTKKHVYEAVTHSVSQKCMAGLAQW